MTTSIRAAASRAALVLTSSAVIFVVTSAVSQAQSAAPVSSAVPTGATAPLASPASDPCSPVLAPDASFLPSPVPSETPGLVLSLDGSPGPDASAAPEPDTGTGSASGDVPDNAVFLVDQDATHGFSIDYVEGWQVTPVADGVEIRDKDSSETVRVMPLPADLAACVRDVELPALAAQDGFSLVRQDRVQVHGRKLIHLVYHLPAPPDPVTGKQVPSTVDRYYVPGPDRLAVVSLSTPDGVDNVDAFRRMIRSLTWS